MLHANETAISSDRGLGLWLVCTVTFLLFLMRAYTNKLSKGKNHREFMFFWKPINANTHWWRSLKSPDSSPYHRTTVTDTNSSDLEVESCHKRIWCPTIKIKNVQCGCAPVTTQFIWMLAKKLKKTLLHHLPNSRHRCAGRNSWCRGAQEVEGWLLLWKLSSPHITISQLRWGDIQRNKLFSPPRAVFYGNKTWKRTH